MGTTQSAAIRAEQELLTAGNAWYHAWQKKKAGALTSAKTSFTTHDVAIGGDLTIHTVRYMKQDEQADVSSAATPLVCMHGFGTGLGIYYAALPALAERWRGSVFAIDTLGCSLSSRPHWHLSHGASCKVSDAEDFSSTAWSGGATP